MLKRSGYPRASAVGLAVLLLSVTSCSRSSDNGVRAYVDEAIAGLGDGYYANSDAWDKAVEDALPGLYAAASIPDTYSTLDQLTKVAGGEHSFLSSPASVAMHEGPYAEGTVPIPTATYDGAVATIEIPAFSSSREEEMAQYLAGAADVFGSDGAQAACGWVIDLRFNTGGNLFTMLAAVSPLLDDGDVEAFSDRDGASSYVNVTGNTVTWDGKVWGSFPGELLKFQDRPIAILQSSSTASAAESVIVAFAGQEGVETFGSQTGGFTTVNDGFALPDGAYVTLSFALMGDRDGNIYEGPIAADHPTSDPGNATLQAAQAWVAGQCGGA